MTVGTRQDVNLPMRAATYLPPGPTGYTPRTGPHDDGRGLPMRATMRDSDDLPPASDPARVDGDHDLIRRAQGGEEAAFAALVKRHERRAIGVARKMVPSDEDAQDLAQEAFLRVFRSLERFDFQHDFTTWLYRIVTNLAIDHLRKRRPAVSTSGLLDDDEADLDLPDPRDDRPSDRIVSMETADEVQECLSTLAPHFQSVLVLRELEGLPCTEIADIVGATHVTVRWRLHRGRKLFQEEWERRQRLNEAPDQADQADQAARGADDGPGNPANTRPIDP